MRALTQFYEQHKNQMAGAPKSPAFQPRNQPAQELESPLQPSLTYHHSCHDPKDSQKDRVPFHSCPRIDNPAAKEYSVARKLSLGRVPRSEEGRMAKIMVFVRLRPMGRREIELGSKSCVRITDDRDVYLTELSSEMDYLRRLNRVSGRHFSFDAAFSDHATQQHVYSTTTADLVQGVLQGRNGSVFCYGSTGAGKTYTMLGTLKNPGVMVLAMKDLFSKIRQRNCDSNHGVHLSYLEVYNETVRDLLSPGRSLVLREDKHQGIVAAGLTHYKAYSTDEVMALLQQGNLNRSTEPTRLNETSSRSHAILQVMVEYREKDSDVTLVGKLSLIDLAGSERAIATDKRTLRSIEGANINRSLLALSSCINALVEGKKHIPYRNSKLTQLLKDSLGGACNSVMIANVSPSSLQFGETQNTLHWADRAKEIKTNQENIIQLIPKSDGDSQAKLLLELQKENGDLRLQLARLQQKLLTMEARSTAAESSPTATAAQRKPMRSILNLNTPSCNSSRKKRNTDVTIEEVLKAKEKLKREHAMQLERLKREQILQMKQKDELIFEITNSAAAAAAASTVSTTVAKKRRFWDSNATSNNPSKMTTERKTRKSKEVSTVIGASPSKTRTRTRSTLLK